MRRFSTGVVCLCLALILGCSGGGTESSDGGGNPSSVEGSSGESRGTIGFSAMSLTNPFFKVIADTLTEAAEAEGFEVVVTDADSDVNEQAKQIDNFISQGVTAIVLNPVDRLAIGPAIEKANAVAIPVFTCDLQCDAEGAEVVAHIGTDNESGGRLAGEAMIEALGENGGDVLVLHYKTANSCVLRVKGFTDVVDAYNSDRELGKINIVAELEGTGKQDVSFSATQDALQQYPNLVGIFAINDPSALGAFTALKQTGKDDQVKIIGFDGQKEGKEAIRDGKIYADPIQFPKKMATGTVANIIKYLDGEDVTEVELIPTALYRQEDALKDPELQ